MKKGQQSDIDKVIYIYGFLTFFFFISKIFFIKAGTRGTPTLTIKRVQTQHHSKTKLPTFYEGLQNSHLIMCSKVRQKRNNRNKKETQTHV
jgi:hypothetical protein